MSKKIWLLIMPIIVLGTTFCSTAPPAMPTPDLATMVAGTMDALTAQAPPAPVSTDTPPPPAVGSIAGSLSYPSEFIPPLRVVAFSLADGQPYYVDTALNQGNYQIDNLPPGTYHVVAYVLDADAPQSGLGGGYSQMVPCGLSVECTNHTLIDVLVIAGQVTDAIDPGDWYAPDGSWPPMP